MWYQKRLFRYTVLTLLILLIIYVGYVLMPLAVIVGDLIVKVITPFIMGLTGYYILRPLLRWLEKRMPVYAALSVVFGLVIFVIVAIFTYWVPIIMEDIGSVQKLDFTKLIKVERDNTIHLFNYTLTLNPQVGDRVLQLLFELNSFLISSTADFLLAIPQFLFGLATVPFILFFLLRDDVKIHHGVMRQVPVRHVDNLKLFLVEVDSTLALFISGRIIIAAGTAALLLAGLLFFRVEYPVFLTLISFLCFTIPTIGAYIAAVPILLIAFSMGATVGIEALILITVCGTIEGFIITPAVMGTQMYIHPLTILAVLLVAGALFGLFGLLLAMPVYAVFKVFLQHREALMHPLKSVE